MSEAEILQHDLRYIFELVRVHKEFNAVPNKDKKSEYSEKQDYTSQDKFIDDIVL